MSIFVRYTGQMRHRRYILISEAVAIYRRASQGQGKGWYIIMDIEMLKKMVISLIEKASNFEKLELLYRFAKKLLG